ncbi:hypothetical protein QIV32_07675 [Enterobacter ludwigii]|nr:hypothetical protein [Enterobacter ludwigii]MDC7312186.1 hypothetical protein [Enterobacter ludwigii]MDI0402238.1 hypothetical protein [Enterobacter ludwigii]MDI0411127.1 hypothetical protein [Enterobacter ludwigii]MDI0417251.1 hypothetical protein [Enterobacter ludwigii]MDI0428272.1 hypothetical protein [Enterobacter ludwigii]
MSRRIALSLWMLAAILTVMTLAASGAAWDQQRRGAGGHFRHFRPKPAA